MVAGRPHDVVGQVLVGQDLGGAGGITPSTVRPAQGSVGGSRPAPASKGGGCSAPRVVGDPPSP
jgi:hypothetical protein